MHLKHSAQCQILPRCPIMLAIIVIMSWTLDAREWHLLYPEKAIYGRWYPSGKPGVRIGGSWVPAQGRAVSGNGGEMPRPKAFWLLEWPRTKKVCLQALLQSCEPHFSLFQGDCSISRTIKNKSLIKCHQLPWVSSLNSPDSLLNFINTHYQHYYYYYSCYQGE